MDALSWVLVALVLLAALAGAIERWPYRRRPSAVRLATVAHCECGTPIPSGCRWCLSCYDPAARAMAEDGFGSYARFRPALPASPISPTIHTTPGGTL
ncbi:hypothetical protein ABZ714_34310 [Streptomyces sp. NPDC006798]|uniref:hypothetical protein n=1 Tax=unclassified Streptomyces TaxID=2593676 RepID=UPI0033264A4E